MKKIFTLLALIMCCAVSGVAGDLYEFYYDNGNKKYTNPDGKSTIFTVAGSDKTGIKELSYVLPSSGATISSAKGLKMNSSGVVTFTPASKAKLTIYLVDNKCSDVNINGTKTEGNVDIPSNFSKICAIIEKEVESGVECKIAKGSDEGTIIYVGVEYLGAALTPLAAPEVSYDAATGLVSIEGENVYYTVDGRVPSAESTKYTESFAVEDATVVKAIALGDGETTTNSDVVTTTVYLSGLEVATPVFKQINGTFALSCTTANATIEYSYNGTDWNVYKQPITLVEATTVAARASRENCTTSTEVTENVTVLERDPKATTIYMGWGSFTNTNATTTTYGVLEGNAGDAAEGFTITCGTLEKSYSNWDKNKFNMEGNERSCIKLSNGATNTLKIKEHYVATRIAIYSTVNLSAPGRDAYWREITCDGVAVEPVNNILMGSFLDIANPDVRIYNLDRAEEVSFTNTGEQLYFTLAVDVKRAVDAPKHFYEADEVTLKSGEMITLAHDDEEAVIYYAWETVAKEETPAEEETESAEVIRKAPAADEYVVYSEKQPVFEAEKDGDSKILHYYAEKAGKISDAKQLVVTRLGETTGIEAIAVDANEGAVEYFNLQGIRVANPSNGIFIRRQGKNVTKVLVK
ncbi:MAG: chitobiase/beta-hexosaminidase C-terminal domain-containing protein [Lachnoclostridium sp.]|nr:chitobiase/beta-hexosaminidase C-terminal domain-containing protein [Lachnoclostridium sp.]